MDDNNGGGKLLKAGQLAKYFGLLTSTIRYYTNLGLLRSAGRSQGGYHLYDLDETKPIIQRINDLKKKRYTLDEIKEKLSVNKAQER